MFSFGVLWCRLLGKSLLQSSMLILQPLSLSRVLQGFASWPGRDFWGATAFGVPQRQSKLDRLPVHPTVPEEKPLGRWINRAGFGLLTADQKALVYFRLFGRLTMWTCCERLN